jgi:hypothetical protein
MGVGEMLAMRKRTSWIALVAIAATLAIAGLVGIAGCGGAAESVSTTAGAASTRPYGSTATTAAAMTTTTWYSAPGEDDSAGGPPSYDSLSSYDSDVANSGSLTAMQAASAAQAASGQRIISDAQLELEVERGKFQMAFDQALMLATRYGGYLVGSNSYASGEDDTMKSGTVAVRVPSSSFAQALSDAGKLGTLKNETLSTQDVTEEYVDLQARIKNSEAHVNSLVALLAQAKTVDEILQVQSVLTYAQQDLEQLKGRLRYLDEHTDYSTITMSIYERGTEPVVVSSWGVGSAFKDALHYLVRVFNGIIRGLGVLVPILIVAAIIGYIVYRAITAASRRNQRKREALYQSQAPNWRQPMPAGSVADPNQAASGAQTGAAPAVQVATPTGQGGSQVTKTPVSPQTKPSADPQRDTGKD